MAWLGVIRPHRRDEAWSASLWQTFFAMYVGAQTSAIAKLPPSACGCKKFALGALGDHVSTCTAGPLGSQEGPCWAVEQIANLFRTTHEVKTLQVAKSRGQRCGDIEFAAGLVSLVLDLRIAQ